MKHIKIALMVAIIAIGQTFIGGNAFARNHLPRLHQAAEDGDIAEITIMLTTMLTTRPRKGVLGLINKKDYYGKTPLHYAVRRFHLSAAALAWDNGLIRQEDIVLVQYDVIRILRNKEVQKYLHVHLGNWTQSQKLQHPYQAFIKLGEYLEKSPAM